MPYGIKKRGSKWVVYNKQSGRTMGTHGSRAAAEKQLAALYANVPEARK